MTVELCDFNAYVFRHHVLQLTDGIEHLGTIRWQLVITLALAWICVFFCLFKGVAVLGKVCTFILL